MLEIWRNRISTFFIPIQIITDTEMYFGPINLKPLVIIWTQLRRKRCRMTFSYFGIAQGFKLIAPFQASKTQPTIPPIYVVTV
jgi:hypothetical protein